MDRSNYKRLGDYIATTDVRNRDLNVSRLLGVSVDKTMFPSIANTIGTDFSTYKILYPGQFVYIPDTSRRGDKIAISLLSENEKVIVSSAYTTFEVLETNRLHPEYLMMWFRRPEFDRYARFKSNGSAREIFSWDEMCEVYLPVPDIAIQRRIVAEYQAVEKRIAINKNTLSNIDRTITALYEHSFVDSINSDNLPDGWHLGKLSDIAKYVKDKIGTDTLQEETYISTENMLKERGGIEIAKSIPSGRATKFSKGNVLISNIRPYFKKIWYATFDGGCSNDVLCFEAINGFSSQFLFSTLTKDEFFDYVMAGSNGVKMPRGDKEWIMKYPVPVPSEELLEDYKRRASILLSHKENLVKENFTLDTILQLLIRKISMQ